MTGPDPILVVLGLAEQDLFCALLALLYTGVVAVLAFSFVFPKSHR